jgi:hypothetical protein
MRAYGLDTPISLVRVLDVLGLLRAIWACQTLPAADLPQLAEFARRCAARVEHLGAAAARSATEAARSAAAATAEAAAAVAADAADSAAARTAAARAAADAARAATDAAAAADAAWHVERAAQIEIFREIFG